MLIAESGSTKTEWRLCKDGQIIDAFRTSGCNPRVQTPQIIEADIRKAFSSHLTCQLPETIHFYGAGLGDQQPKLIIREILKRLLPDVQVYVEHDMLAAARSSCRAEGIACILGTGSNTCYHKNYQVIDCKGGFGYLVADEGSGADMGKHLLKKLLQGELSLVIKERFESQLQQSVQETLTSLMLAPKPNVLMASWAEYVHAWLEDEQIQQMVEERFLAFLDTTICLYESYQHLQVDFVGSIGHYFSEQLKKACQKRKVLLGSIVKDPIDNLVNFHLSGLMNEEVSQ